MGGVQCTGRERFGGVAGGVMDGWMAGWVGGWVGGLVGEWGDGCMDAWMYGRMDLAWMDGMLFGVASMVRALSGHSFSICFSISSSSVIEPLCWSWVQAVIPRNLTQEFPKP